MWAVRDHRLKHPVAVKVAGKVYSKTEKLFQKHPDMIDELTT